MDAIRPAAIRSPAEIYDEQFVPALFEPFSRALADAARLRPGQRVLDVACGTGVLTCTASQRVGQAGAVVGLDINPEMLAVARRKPFAIEWVDGRAEALPFPDASFDAVVSQFGMMFFEDRVAALREMRRVLRAGGHLAVAVCDAVEHSSGYGALATLLQRLFGDRIADAFRAPFSLGDAAMLRSLCVQAELAPAQIATVAATVRFASIDALVSTERACVWTLGGLLDDAQFERLRTEAQGVLRPFVQSDGTVAFEIPALLIAADPGASGKR
jgi:SAM-dependent methyltransferase